MKINFQSPTFKGYDALRLKALHLNYAAVMNLSSELDDVAHQEGFSLRTTFDQYKWAQDQKTIILKRKKPILIYKEVLSDFDDKLYESFPMPQKASDYCVTGGNCFIGKFFNRDRWMLIGEDDFHSCNKEGIAKEYDIKPSNIIPLPQQDYHLDMFMRPIGYPYILINDPTLVSKKFASMDWEGYSEDFIDFEDRYKKQEKDRQRNQASHKKTINALKKAGFEPIRIAGVFGSGINFMNAIVNEHSNGTISYITNGSLSKNPFTKRFQESFERDLRQSVPNIDKVHFVCGEKHASGNYLTDQISVFCGGLHCLTMEEPDFDVWA